MTLDITTILILFLLNNLSLAALLAVSFWRRRTPATDLWITSLLVQTVAWVLYIAPGKVPGPGPVAIVLTTTLLSLSYCMLTEAFCDFFEFPVKRRWIYFPALLTLVAVWWNLDNLANRNIVGGLIFSAQFLAAAIIILMRNDKWHALRTFISVTAIVTAIMFFARAAIAFNDPAAITLLNVTSPFQTASFLIGDAARLAFSFGFLLLIEARRSDELTRLAALDPLTEVYNRRTFIELAERELARSKRCRQPMGMMILDLDHFKKVNDSHGHLAGDAVLRQIKTVAENCLRQQDVFGRYGGEEFCVLAPDTDLAGTHALAERLRQGIENCNLLLPNGKELHITASIGVSAMSADRETTEFNDLIEVADLALYEAKKRGRNRVEVDPTVKGAKSLTEHEKTAIAQLVWHDHFCSGNTMLDTQHRGLFDDSNHLLSAILSGHSSSEVGAAVDKLMCDMVRHFQDEEELLAATGYPHAVAHAALHNELKRGAVQLVERFRNGNLDIGAFFQFLASDVVAKHMLSDDREFFSHLQRHSDSTLSMMDNG